MSKQLLRLFPTPSEMVPMGGLYLQEKIHLRGRVGAPFVYANFLSSLDGRIALEDESGVPFLPKSLTTDDDFRLFLELHAQADCLITHGGYLRALHEGRLGNILQVGAHELGRDLPAWRREQGLAPQPAIVVASASLDFPVPESIRDSGQRLLIATGREADPDRIFGWQARGYDVILAGAGREVNGGVLAQSLSQRGFKTVYLIAGPMMLETMLREEQLSVLYQTFSHQLLGGEAFRSMVPGPILGESGKLRLASLFYDVDAGGGVGQWFAKFEPTSAFSAQEKRIEHL